ncbi:MAG TPA: cardiolipin synthase, partial [Lachnospiraceae bacterium]|nr:cardiolipin synthase [Lachnospiraceae bacterium]
MRFLGKIYKVIFSRVFITAMLIILQVIWFLLIYSYFFVGYEYVRTAVSALALLYTIYIINSPKTMREYQTEWIIVILLFPFFGVPFYMVCGDQRQGRRYAKRVEDAKAKYSTFHNQDMNIMDELYKLDSRLHSTSTYLMRSQGYPIYKNTSVTYLSSGEEQYEELLKAMKKAKHYIFMEYFMIERTGVWNSVLEVLKAKAEEGVEVRILYDDLGCITWLPKRYDRTLNSMHKNIHCKKFNRVKPLFTMLTNNRDHRKMTIIDGYIAFTGGINLADRYVNVNSPFGRWKDAGVKLEGEAVQNFTLMYLEMWESMKMGRSSRKIETPEEMKKINSYLPHFFHESEFVNDGYVQPFGDEPFDNVPLSENAYLELINQAEKYLYVFTPYLVPSQSVMDALSLAAERGVDVRIVTPHIPDKRITFRMTRSNYKKLMDHGV